MRHVYGSYLCVENTPDKTCVSSVYSNVYVRIDHPLPHNPKIIKLGPDKLEK